MTNKGKQKKRQKRVKERLTFKRLRIRKEKREERKAEEKERLLGSQIEKGRAISMRSREIPRKLLPGPNQPCICGKKDENGKPIKFKKCCQADIESGKIKIVAEEDPRLQKETGN